MNSFVVVVNGDGERSLGDILSNYVAFEIANDFLRLEDAWRGRTDEMRSLCG